MAASTLELPFLRRLTGSDKKSEELTVETPKVEVVREVERKEDIGGNQELTNKNINKKQNAKFRDTLRVFTEKYPILKRIPLKIVFIIVATLIARETISGANQAVVMNDLNQRIKDLETTLQNNVRVESQLGSLRRELGIEYTDDIIVSCEENFANSTSCITMAQDAINLLIENPQEITEEQLAFIKSIEETVNLEG